MSSYLPNNYHGLVVRCTAMGWFLVFIEIHARPTFQNVQMSHHNLSFSSKDCELDSDPLVLNKPWCDVNFRSQIVYMIFTGLKPRLCNMFIIHIYIYIFFNLGGWRCMFISFWDVFCHHKHRFWKTFQPWNPSWSSLWVNLIGSLTHIVTGAKHWKCSIYGNPGILITSKPLLLDLYMG